MAISIFLIVASNCVCASVYRFAGEFTERMEVNMDVPAGTGEYGAVHCSDMGVFFKRYCNGAVAYSSSMDTFISNGVSQIPVKAELTDSGYAQFVGLEMARGTYFSEDACKYGRNVAVISERLATSLFKSLEAVGNEIVISGAKYLIVGVYRNRDSIFSFSNDDGLERVYITFKSIDSYNTMDIGTICINEQSLDDMEFREKSIQDFMAAEFGTIMHPYKVTDFYNIQKRICQLKDIFVYLVALICICLLSVYLIIYLKGHITYIKDTVIRRMYFTEFLRTKKFYIFGLFAAVFAYIGIVAAIIAVSGFELDIPAVYIPQDNIFDLGFYFERVKQAIIHVNSTRNYEPSPFESFYSCVGVVNTILVICTIPTFYTALSGIRLMKMAKAPATAHFKTVVLSLILGLGFSALFTFIARIVFLIPFRDLAITLLFFIMASMRRSHFYDLSEVSWRRFM